MDCDAAKLTSCVAYSMRQSCKVKELEVVTGLLKSALVKLQLTCTQKPRPISLFDALCLDQRREANTENTSTQTTANMCTEAECKSLMTNLVQAKNREMDIAQDLLARQDLVIARLQSERDALAVKLSETRTPVRRSGDQQFSRVDDGAQETNAYVHESSDRHATHSGTPGTPGRLDVPALQTLRNQHQADRLRLKEERREARAREARMPDNNLGSRTHAACEHDPQV